MQTEPRMEALVGAVLEGAYQITRLVGEGGMGAVYEAVQLRLNKRVAVKVMARHLAADQKALARFHREAEITSRLGHPHLVSVVDYGQAESGEPYLVMEFLEGEDLDHRLQRVGQLPIDAVSRVVRQVASALGAAHDQGIVHRDLKPGNIFLLHVPGEPDFVKVLDFGISKIMASRTRLTNMSSAVGTPVYMSPEQATGMVEAVDHRVDQWALACIAWEMLLGRPPFLADDVSALMYQIIRMEPHPLAPSVPGLPQDVETVLRRSLRKRPEDRFASIREFSHAFESAALGRPADETPVPMLVGAPAEPLSMSLFELEETQIAETSGPEVVPAASVSHVELPADAGSPISVTDIVHLQPQRRLRPALVLTAGAGIGLLLLLGAFLLFRSSPGPKPQIPKNNDTLPVVSPPVVGQPSVTPLASPPPAPTENIAPDPKHVKSTGFETEFARLKRAKAPAPNSSPRQDKSGHPGVQTPRPKPKRQLIEEL